MQSWCARFVMRGRQLQCGQSTDKILMLLLPDLKPDYFVCSSKARHKSSTHPLSTGDQHRYLGGEGARDLGATHINTSVDSKPASQPISRVSTNCCKPHQSIGIPFIGSFPLAKTIVERLLLPLGTNLIMNKFVQVEQVKTSTWVTPCVMFPFGSKL